MCRLSRPDFGTFRTAATKTKSFNCLLWPSTHKTKLCYQKVLIFSLSPISEQARLISLTKTQGNPKSNVSRFSL